MTGEHISQACSLRLASGGRVEPELLPLAHPCS